jgi:hypothetical protein
MSIYFAVVENIRICLYCADVNIGKSVYSSGWTGMAAVEDLAEISAR